MAVPARATLYLQHVLPPSLTDTTLSDTKAALVVSALSTQNRRFLFKCARWSNLTWHRLCSRWD